MGSQGYTPLMAPEATGNLFYLGTRLLSDHENIGTSVTSGRSRQTFAPFTPDIRASTSVAEASFNLNVADPELMSDLPSPLNASFGGFPVTPNSIAQILSASGANSLVDFI